MADCVRCGKKALAFTLYQGKCDDCFRADERERKAEEVLEQSRQLAGDRAVAEAAARIILTTETAHNLPVAVRLDIVTAEVVIGMHLFKDIASMFRDTFGGRSKVMQQGLRDARKTALDELRLEALNLGADAVVGIDLDYSEISGQGKSMLLLVASGTAVTLEKRPQAGICT